jgi:hypothetical protein
MSASPLSIVVPFRGELETTLAFLDSLGRHEPLTLVDDHTPEASVGAALRAMGHGVLRPRLRPYYNGALRWAIETAKTEFLGVLNNDLILPENFVGDVLEAFGQGWDMLVPSTAPEGDSNRPGVEPLDKQEGWCMLMRVSAVREIPPVPTELRLWYGDTWLFHHAWKAGLQVGKIRHVVVQHLRSHTMRARAAEVDEILQSDGRAATPYRLQAHR